MSFPVPINRECEFSSRIRSSAPRTVPGENDRWYAVYTLPNREQCARVNLENQGFKTFLPLFSKNIRHARQSRTILAPLFPRYLFMTLDLQRDGWRSVNGTLGVASIVMQNGAPVPVFKGIVEALQASVDETGGVCFSRLKQGQSVRVVSGPFAEQLGVLEHMAHSERVWVLLNMMNSKVRVVMNIHSLVPGFS